MTEKILHLSLDKLEPDPKQPRRVFDAEKLEELAGSIKHLGLMQPIQVRPKASKGDQKYYIISGERRWRAHKILRLRNPGQFTTIQSILLSTKGEADLRLKQLAENVSRDDLTPLDEARAYGELVKLGMDANQIARKLGQVPFRVRWRLQLLNLAPDIIKLVESNNLDRQQALELARLPGHAEQHRLLKLIARGNLVGWKAVRNAVEAIVNKSTQADIFGKVAEVSKEDRKTVKSMEGRVEKMIHAINTGWKDGECILAARVDPNRANKMADQLNALQTTLRIMERQLRNVSAQASIVLDADKIRTEVLEEQRA